MARERDFYLSRVERAKVLTKIKQRKNKRKRPNTSESSEQSSLSNQQHAIISSDDTTQLATSKANSQDKLSGAQFNVKSDSSNIEGVLHKVFRS